MPVLHPPLPPPLTVSRPFAYAGSPFAAGLHRGVDLAAPVGTSVRSPCGGTVAWAGARGVTLRCGEYRVTLLPVAPSVATGGRVARGAPVGTLTAGHAVLAAGTSRPAASPGSPATAPVGAASARHAGTSPGGAALHVGVRRAGDAFGYVKPRFAAGRAHLPPPLVGPGRVRTPTAAPKGTRPLPTAVPLPAARPVTTPDGRAVPLAPWPAWAGLALVLGAVRVRRRRRSSSPVRSPARQRSVAR